MDSLTRLQGSLRSKAQCMDGTWETSTISHVTEFRPKEAEEVIENEPLDLDVQIGNGEERTPHLGETKGGRIVIVIAAWNEETHTTRVVTVFIPSKAQCKSYLEWKGIMYGRNVEDTGLSKPGRRSSLVGRESDDG